MKKQDKLILGAVGLVVVGGYLVFSYIKNKKTKSNIEDEMITDLISNEQAVKQNVHLTSEATFPMKLGSRGKQVAVLQKYLNNKGYPEPNLVVDGIWGEKTDLAVSKLLTTPYEKEIAEWRTDALLKRKLSGNQITREFYDRFVLGIKPKAQVPNIFKV